MSVLFCDLVGFTAASEAADPEDVRARLRPYHARLRQEIERYGGTVEKFIGDAVMAVFGAPVAHEDDAERAVRAGLADPGGDRGAERRPIRRSRCRCGSGSTRARRSSRSARGPSRARGSSPATSSTPRRACRAPRRSDGVAVVGADVPARPSASSTTSGWSRCAVKGKARAARALAAAAAAGALRLGRDPHARDAAGRPGAGDGAPDRDVRAGRAAALVPARDDRRRAGRGQEPPLRRAARATSTERPGLVRWRQGRCLPYGDGIAFWALGEIVKAECGILESDSPAQAAAKLERAVARRRSGPRLAAGPPGAARRGAGGAGRAGGVVRGLAALLRGARGRADDGARVRGPALGRRRAARLPRAPGRLGGGRAAAAPLHGAAGAVRAASDLRRRTRATRSGSTSRR